MTWSADNSSLIEYKERIDAGEIVAGMELRMELDNLVSDIRENDEYIYNTDAALLRMEFMQNCVRLTKSPFYF